MDPRDARKEKMNKLLRKIIRYARNVDQFTEDVLDRTCVLRYVLAILKGLKI
jgi:hypothetical protein